MFVEIAEAIKKYSPKAWVINYTNPLALCVRTLYKVFPEIKAFGCCHEVFNTQNLLASMCKEEIGVDHIDRHEINVNVMGINHFTWFNHASYQGLDLFPMYERFANEHSDTGYPKNFDGYLTDVFACGHKVKFDLFRKYGLIAAAGDRHLAEFMRPNYLKDIDFAHSYSFTFTPVDYRIEDLNNRRKRSERLLTGEEKLDYTPSGEEGILLIKSLVGLERTISNVNLPNIGQISNLPSGAIIETNAVFEKDHIAPVFAGKLPDDVKALLDPHIQNQADIMESGVNYNKELAIKAFLNDPLMTISESNARKLFDEMLENTKAYLPKEWL
jgi:alpha-galactosidase